MDLVKDAMELHYGNCRIKCLRFLGNTTEVNDDDPSCSASKVHWETLGPGIHVDVEV